MCREGLLYKLFNMGIIIQVGQLLEQDFIKNQLDSKMEDENQY